MRRRQFIALVAVAVSAIISGPFAVCAQQRDLPVIGFLTGHSPSAFAQQRLAALKKGLAEVGLVAGKNVAIEARWAEAHYDRLPALVADLIRRQAKVIVTDTTPAALAAKAATTTIPIVFALSTDPVALGLVSSLDRPGGNLTGATRLSVGLGPKRLQLAHEMLPAAKSMALLVNPANPAIAEPERTAVGAAARTLGIELHVLEAGEERGIDQAFAAALQRRVSAVIVTADALFADHIAALGTLSVRHRMPTIFTYREFVAAGGLAGYSGSLTDAAHISGVYAGRILKGEKPADLPVQQSTKVQMIINVKSAKALGITVPPSVLARADEVIE